MRRLSAILIIGAAGSLMAAIGFIVVSAVEPNSTVCHGTRSGSYCDTHANHWVIAGLVTGMIIGGVVALAAVRRSGGSGAP